jgi:hypothetical protein
MGVACFLLWQMIGCRKYKGISRENNMWTDTISQYPKGLGDCLNFLVDDWCMVSELLLDIYF